MGIFKQREFLRYFLSCRSPRGAVCASARTSCEVECHLGRISTFAAVAAKSGHIAHAWAFVFGYERPTYASSFSGTKDTCEGCHTNHPHRHNVVNTEKRFSTDRQNTETKLTLTVRLNGRNFTNEDSRGVNWHASGAVRFIADDPQNLGIRWVEVTLPDGSKKIYNDVRAPLNEADIKKAEIQVMDCVACHNRAGHPFLNPEEEVDAALADGRLDSDLPFIKARVVELFMQEFETEEDARALVHDAWESYAEEFPEVETDNPAAWNSAFQFLHEHLELMGNLMVRSQFMEEGVSWRSFPDHNGHNLDPGCFRCHSGRLQSAEGTPIPVNCTTCHSIPLVTKQNKVPEFFLTLTDKQKPGSHRDPAFISRHMFLVGETCTLCHGDIRFGANDGSYCSNSGCHGDVWEFLDLDAVRSARAIARTIERD
jgi:hypothetical protein